MVKPVGWTHDGRVVWIDATPSGRLAIWTMPVDGEPAPFLQESARIFEARVSPEGRWIAYSTNRSGRPEIEVTSFPVLGPRYLVTVDGGGYPRWRADGRDRPMHYSK
jgi:eukaryotic-like serine/threonine-protein kinase